MSSIHGYLLIETLCVKLHIRILFCSVHTQVTRSDFLYTGLEYELTSVKLVLNVTLLVHSLCHNPCKFPPYHSKIFRLAHVHLLHLDCQVFL